MPTDVADRPRIQQKLGAGSMQGLVLWAVRNGLLDDYTEEAEPQVEEQEEEASSQGAGGDDAP